MKLLDEMTKTIIERLLIKNDLYNCNTIQFWVELHMLQYLFLWRIYFRIISFHSVYNRPSQKFSNIILTCIINRA